MRRLADVASDSRGRRARGVAIQGNLGRSTFPFDRRVALRVPRDDGVRVHVWRLSPLPQGQTRGAPFRLPNRDFSGGCAVVRFHSSRDAEQEVGSPSRRATPGSKSPGGGDPGEPRAPFVPLDRRVALPAPRNDGVTVPVRRLSPLPPGQTQVAPLRLPNRDFSGGCATVRFLPSRDSEHE